MPSLRTASARGVPVQRWGYISPPETGPHETRSNVGGRQRSTAGVGPKTQHLGRSNIHFEPEEDDRNSQTDGHTITAAPHEVENGDGDVNVKKNGDSNSDDNNVGSARDIEGTVNSIIRNDNECGNRGLLLRVRPGPKGAEKAVTFAVQSLNTGSTRRNGGTFIRARLDCSGSVNVSPLPGSMVSCER